MDAWLFPGEEEQPERAIANHGGRRRGNVAEPDLAWPRCRAGRKQLATAFQAGAACLVSNDRRFQGVDGMECVSLEAERRV